MYFLNSVMSKNVINKKNRDSTFMKVGKLKMKFVRPKHYKLGI